MRQLYAILSALALATGCGFGAPGVPDAPTPCEQAITLRARVPALLAEGRVDRARRFVARADALCPGDAPPAAALADLAREDAAAGANGVSGVALVEAGLQARRAGRRAEAQRLFDRGLRELERASRKAPSLDAPNGFGIDGSGEDALETAAWSPRGDVLAVVHGRWVSLLDGVTLRERMRFGGDEAAIDAVAWSPNGGTLVAAGGGGARIWDVATGAMTARVVEPDRPRAVAISPDGRLMVLASSTQKRLHLWELPAVVRRIGLEGDSGSVDTIAWSRNGSVIASTATDGGEIRIWDAVREALTGTIHAAPWKPHAFALSPNGDAIALVESGESLTAEIWDTTRLRITARLMHPAGPVQAVAFAPDGESIFTSSDDRSIQVWARRTGALVREIDRRANGLGVASALDVSPDGKKVAAVSVDDVRLIDIAAERETARLAGHAPDPAAVAFVSGGLKVAAALRDRTLRVWDLGPRGRLFTLATFEKDPAALAASPDGAWIASSTGTTIDLWDARSGASKVTLGSHPEDVIALAFAKDGKVLMSVSGDAVTRLWAIPTGRPLEAISPGLGAITAAAFSADGARVAYACREGTTRVWDIHARKELAVIKGGQGAISAIALSPDGSIVATGLQDQTVRVSSAADARELAVLRGHRGMVLALAVSPDGSTLASGSNDTTARLWSLPSGRPVRTLEGHHEWISEVAWSGAGDVLLTAAIDGTMRLWRADGAGFVSLRPVAHADAGYVLAPTGHIELFGEAARAFPICRVGPWSFPLEVCEERFAVKGLAPRALAGERLYLDP